MSDTPMSVNELKRLLEKRQREVRRLTAQHALLIKKAGVIEAQIAQLTGGQAASGVATRKTAERKGKKMGKRGYARNATTLLEALKKVVHKDKPQSVMELAKAAQKAGYKSTSSSFRTIVNQTLLKHPEIFKKAAFGKYIAG